MIPLPIRNTRGLRRLLKLPVYTGYRRRLLETVGETSSLAVRVIHHTTRSLGHLHAPS